MLSAARSVRGVGTASRARAARPAWRSFSLCGAPDQSKSSWAYRRKYPQDCSAPVVDHQVEPEVLIETIAYLPGNQASERITVLLLDDQRWRGGCAVGGPPFFAYLTDPRIRRVSVFFSYIFRPSSTNTPTNTVILGGPRHHTGAIDTQYPPDYPPRAFYQCLLCPFLSVPEGMPCS